MAEAPFHEHPQIFRLPESVHPVWAELDEARRRLDRFEAALRRATGPTAPSGSAALARALSPFRCLVLAYIGRQTVFGVTPSRLAHLLATPRPLLDYHLDLLSEHELIYRQPRGLYDRRKVSIRLTWAGGEALALATRTLARLEGAAATPRQAADAEDAGEGAPPDEDDRNAGFPELSPTSQR